MSANSFQQQIASIEVLSMFFNQDLIEKLIPLITTSKIRDIKYSALLALRHQTVGKRQVRTNLQTVRQRCIAS